MSDPGLRAAMDREEPLKWERKKVAGGQKPEACLRINCCALGGHIPSLGIMQRWSQISNIFIPQLSTPELLPRAASTSPPSPRCAAFSLCFFCRQWQDGENLETGSGREGRGRWWGGGWAGSQSLKISQTAETQGWPAEVRRHTFSFSYFCCFFHNIQSLPYKLMT